MLCVQHVIIKFPPTDPTQMPIPVKFAGGGEAAEYAHQTNLCCKMQHTNLHNLNPFCTPHVKNPNHE
eukprot:2704969-Amphidinium_carterae.1